MKLSKTNFVEMVGWITIACGIAFAYMHYDEIKETSSKMYAKVQKLGK